ncbi:MAG: NAD(P)/FAD-dependent oxidoreductase [Chloroflexi bacterium]|nr:NAD(P)/FAD-dependent oxidoreductase [Chloroflexota bacterium]MQC25765.1 FAD-dependent oxidoreductase [Chloroflexota bacterium]MQC48507.1 FAD-dependent oxidoreductase [Chloroflexota bacterium]
MKVIVIGGGMAGLGAAYELLKRGHEVALYEASPEFGGQVRTFEIGGERIEIFYHHLFQSDFEAVQVLDELGLIDDVAWIDSNVGLHAAGKNYPFVGALDLLRFDRVSLLSRLRLGLTALWLRRVDDYRRYEGTRAAEWIRSHVGREGYERVWGPLLRAKFSEHAEDVSMVWFWGKIYLRFASRPKGGLPLVGSLLAKEQLGYLRGSFGRLVDGLVAACRGRGGALTAGAPVDEVIVEDGRAVGVRLVDGHEDRADAVLATTPSGLFRKIVPGLQATGADGAQYASMLDAVQYQWATVLLLTLDRPLSEIYWLTMTDDDAPFVVAVEQTNFIPAEVYGGNHIVYFSDYMSPNDPMSQMSVEEILDLYEPWIRRINPDFDRSWIRDQWVFRDRAGQPVVRVGYHEIIPPHRTPIPGLYLANTTQIYPEDRGQNYSLRMGRRVASLVESDGAGG